MAPSAFTVLIQFILWWTQSCRAWLLLVANIRWCSLSRGLHHSNLCLHLSTICASVSIFSSSYKDNSHWIRAHSNVLEIHLNLITSSKTQISKLSYIHDFNQEVRTYTYAYTFGGILLNPNNNINSTKIRRGENGVKVLQMS